MEAKTGKFFESVGAFLDGDGDQIPWCDLDVIAGCEKEVADAANGGSEEHKSECNMWLSWALVHSRQAEDIQRGIAMLEASLASSSSPLQKREKLYLLAVGYYRSGEYGKSRQPVLKLVVKASKIRLSLVIAPDFRQVLTLKKTVEDWIAKVGVTGKGITASAVVGLIAGGIAGGIAAALARKK